MREVKAVKIEVAKEWSDLSNTDCLKVLKFINQGRRLPALFILSDMKLNEFRDYPSYIQYDLLQLVNDFYMKEFNHSTIYSFRGISFVKSDLSNITCFQWYLAEYYSKDLSDVSSLNNLISCLIFVNDKAISKDIDLKFMLKKVNRFLVPEKDYIFKRYFYLKSQVLDLLSKNEMLDNGDDNQTNWGWTGVFQDVAERQIFGSLADVHQTRFIDLLSFLFRNKQKSYLGNKSCK